MKEVFSLLLLTTICVGFPEPKQYQPTAYRLLPMQYAIDQGGMKMLMNYFQEAKDKNVISSPLCKVTLMCMLLEHSNDKTQVEIVQYLDSINLKQLEDSYSNFTERYTLLRPKGYQISGDGKQSSNNEVEKNECDQEKTSEPDDNTKRHVACSQTMNTDWAKVILNVMLFQRHWHVPFSTKNAVEKDFYVSDSKIVKKPMMKLRGHLFHREYPEIEARMIELPYEEEDLRMIIILPDKRYGLAEVVEKLAQKGILENVMALYPVRQEVAFEIPKFMIKNSPEVDEILVKIGAFNVLFEGKEGNEVLMSLIHHRPEVSNAFQEAFVEYDEEGNVTDSLIGNCKPALHFNADHPFMFAILYQGLVMFTGTYTH